MTGAVNMRGIYAPPCQRKESFVTHVTRSNFPPPFDNPKRFHYGSDMAEYTLKNIPEDIYRRAQVAAEQSYRSLNQEILYRLNRSFDSDDARVSALHARWVMEALQSGPVQPLKIQDMDAAFSRGIAAARRRRKAG